MRRAKTLARKRLGFHGQFTHRPAAKVLLRLLDMPGRALFPEVRQLPPNYLRCRVGVGGRIFGNEIMYLTRGLDLWLFLLANDDVGWNSDIIEIGCGCGRRTHLLRDFNFHGLRYTGHYIGIDVDAEMLDWCRNNFDSERFEFHQSTHETKAYENDMGVDAYYALPAADASIDLVFGTSVLTHLLENQLANYFRESYRVLKETSAMVMTCKCLDLDPDLRGNTYRHQIGNAYVENEEVPQMAVAYEERFILDACREEGFSSARIYHQPGDVQQTLVARK
ncbi:MAG: class I SAM-dependent methyltransferase [Actinomycetota bacterium]|nr:class I SAM-dependent methyltransferase [Actinomycetota bacterium]